MRRRVRKRKKKKKRKMRGGPEEDVEALQRHRSNLVLFCLEHAEVLGVLASALASSALLSALEPLCLKLVSSSRNAAALASGVLRAQLLLATNEAKTALRGNSFSMRLVVAALAGEAHLGQAVNAWLQSDTEVNAEASALALVKELTARVDRAPPALSAVARATGAALAEEAALPVLGSVVFLRVVCPLVMRPNLASAKALQAASNGCAARDSELCVAVRSYLKALMETKRSLYEAGPAECNLNADECGRVIQIVALNLPAIFAARGSAVEESLLKPLTDLVRLAEPFKPSVSKAVLSKTTSTVVIEHERNAKKFFAENGLSERFVTQYFELNAATRGVEWAVRVANFVSNPEFGVPQKKGVFVGRDLVDWLVEFAPMTDRERAAEFCRDMMAHKLVVSDNKRLRGSFRGNAAMGVFVDGDAFYHFDAELLAQLTELLLPSDGSGAGMRLEGCCSQCKKKASKIDGYCEYCGYESGE